MHLRINVMPFPLPHQGSLVSNFPVATGTNALVNFMSHPPNTGDLTSWCQIPHYWGKIGCQIPTMSPPP